jgi:creatinine amidohydrolase
MEQPGTPVEFETRYEWLRPGQLVERRNACPLVIVPVAPLEYHGPHMPVGCDMINVSEVAHAVCRKLGRGVVRPVLSVGTERERPPDMLQSLGFPPDSYVVGMDFPTRLWNSHYLSEEVFALVLRAELAILIGQGYRYVFVASGHGAVNQQATIARLSIELQNTTPARLDYDLAICREAIETGLAGHADVVETSLLLHYRPDAVDLAALPPRGVPLRYQDYSVVDGAGFSAQYDPQHLVRHDPRDATAAKGQKWFADCVQEMSARIDKWMAK